MRGIVIGNALLPAAPRRGEGVLILVLTLTLALAACDSDDGTGGGTSTDTSTSGGDDTTATGEDDAAAPGDEDATTPGDVDAGPVDEDATEPVGDPLEVIGSWDTNFGWSSEITADKWDGSAIVAHDNAENWAIIEMPEDAQWNPGTFSKFVWTEPVGGRWFLCIVTYALDTAEAAENTTATADDASPLEGGCGDFAWTELRIPLEVKGDWHTNWDENLSVSTYAWGSHEAVVAHDNDANWAVTRVWAGADWNPGTYSRLVWTEPEDDGSFWMCPAAYGLETESAAMSDTTQTDDTDPATGGCGSSPWTHLMPIVEITGSWLSEGDETFKIDSTVWGLDLVHDYDNDANWAVVQLPATDEWNPDKFMKNVWTEPTTDGFYYCSVAFGLETLAEALATEDTSDATDPATTGCGSFPWTWMAPAAP